MVDTKEFKFYQKSAEYVQSRIDFVPETALILGTALGGLAEKIENPVEIPYAQIPNFLVSTVKDHAGKLILGRMHGKNVVCMSGRFHYYEGYDFSQLVIPVRLFKLLGVKTLILTNAAGAINTGYRPGDVMIIKDHLNLMGAAPTRGKNIDEFGRRFFDVSNAYDKDLIKLAHRCAADTTLRIQEGVYVFCPGPQFETPAEIRFYRMAGGDAAGMSTVPEVLAAAQCGLRVLGLSLMTNMAAGILSEPIDGQEVDEVGKRAKAGLQRYIGSILEKL